MDKNVEFLKNELTRKGLRPSYQRIKVLEYLHQHGGHPTADAIYAFLAMHIPSLSKTTVYNALHSLVEAGLARVVCIDGSEQRFDITLSNHGHFKCDQCGAIFNFAIDIDVFPVDDLNAFQITEKNVYFNGLCPNCIPQDSAKKE